jgi:heme O synthase-like polyprenyltransferase
VLLALLVLGGLFVALTLPLWRAVTPRLARRGFIYSGPYLLGVVLAIVANAPLVRLGFGLGL